MTYLLGALELPVVAPPGLVDPDVADDPVLVF